MPNGTIFGNWTVLGRQPRHHLRQVRPWSSLSPSKGEPQEDDLLRVHKFHSGQQEVHGRGPHPLQVPSTSALQLRSLRHQVPGAVEEDYMISVKIAEAAGSISDREDRKFEKRILRPR